MTAPALGGIWNYQGRTTYDPAALEASDPAMQQLIQSGVLTKAPAFGVTSQQTDSEGKLVPLYEYQIDYSKLPQTRYGSLMDQRQIDIPSGNAVGGFKVRDPRLVYDDPNYGRLTPSWNTVDPSKQRNFYDMIGPLVMGAVLGGAGMGVFGAGPTASGSGLSLGKTVLSGLQRFGSSPQSAPPPAFYQLLAQIFGRR